MAKSYQVMNGAAPGAAAPVAVASGAVIKTMIQLSTSANREARITEWWWEGDGATAAAPVKVELVRHGTGPCTTVTAYVAADIMKYEPNSVASALTLGTSNSGYTATAEVTPATAPNSIAHFVPPTSGIYIQYPLGREPEMAVSTFARIRNTAQATVNVYAGVVWEE
jgi:hypothetical protein